MNTPENTNSAVLKTVIKNNLVWEDIKNKPFYEGIEEVTVEYDPLEDGMELIGFPPFKVGDTVSIKVDGITHSLVAYDFNGLPVIGDSPNGSEGESLLGWFAGCVDGHVIFVAFEASHTITYEAEVVHTIEQKYLPKALRFGSEYKKEVVIDFGETEVTGTYYDSTQFYINWDLDPLPSFVEGETYIVEFCGGKYEAYAESFGTLIFETEDGRYTIGIHNINNGKLKYVSFYGPNKGVTSLPFTTSLKVTRYYEDVTTIEEKYIPEIKGHLLHAEIRPLDIIVDGTSIDSDGIFCFTNARYCSDGVTIRNDANRLITHLKSTTAPTYVYAPMRTSKIGEVFYYSGSNVYGVFFHKEENKMYNRAFLLPN